MKLTVNNAPVFVATGGGDPDMSRPAVVLIHGSGQGAPGWSQFTRALGAAGYAALAPDLPGHGLSGGAPLATIENAADWLAAFLDAAGLESAHLVGHSQGSLVALETAARTPGRVRSLTILASAAGIPVNPGLIKLAEKNEPAAVAAMTAWGHGASGHAHGSDVPGMSPMGFGAALMRRNQPGVLAADLKACATYDGGDAAAEKVACPALCVLAERDKMTPMKGGAALAKALNAQMRVIPNAGHMLPGERPIETLAEVKAFMRSVA